MSNIQWFPGHMTRARRKIEEKLKMIDIVFELLDARIPLASQNPLIEEIIGSKPRLILLNKADLADAKRTKQWQTFFRSQNLVALPLDSLLGQGIKDINEQAKKLLRSLFDKQKVKGIKPRPMRALIIGIPNVGKSTLINRLAGKNVAQTGDRPGVTKGQQWIRLNENIDLLDTPGILWPKFESQRVGYLLATTGAIRESIFHLDEVACFILFILVQYYFPALKKRYGLIDPPKEMDQQAAMDVLCQIGQKRGCMVKGGGIDYEKAASILLRELRSGKLGRISFEWPKE